MSNINTMEIEAVDDLLLLSESVQLECKLAGGRDGKGELPNDVWSSYSAMANTEGGVILLGVKQKGERFTVNGIEKFDSVRQQIFNVANNRNKVSANLLTDASVQPIEIDGKTLIRIEVRRAPREQRPVFLNGNPLGNTYVRLHEGDQVLSDEAVKRMLAEQVEDSRDSRILKGFGIDDLWAESLRAYRQLITNRQPDHLWNTMEDQPFLKAIGAWRMDRESGESGLTAAGLLMFGSHSTIQEVFPNYMLDYQERSEAKTERRWIDRVTLDGTWSGNLFDFYRKVFLKLTEAVKVPFELSGDQRIDETPIHTAIREALCNTLVHADYTDRASVLVVRRPDLFGFRNPGMMRIPADVAIVGGHADCRNRLLHQMFRYVGIGDQAGSGVPKIMASWNDYHWRLPVLEDRREPNDQTLLTMRMIDLLPQKLVDQLKQQLGDAFNELPHESLTALVIADAEGTLSNQRLCSLCQIHLADGSRYLRDLVEKGLLEKTGTNRGAVYHRVGTEIPGPEDVFDSPNLESSSPNLESSSPNLESSSPNLEPSSPNLSMKTGNQRDSEGRLISEAHPLHFIDNLEFLSEEYLTRLKGIAEQPRAKKKLSRDLMVEVITGLSRGHFITIGCLAELVNREPETLRGQYLSQMVKDGSLLIAFPKTPNDPRQAYTLNEAHE
ncbi:MAG: putative DNA binding domain-containing protein [Cycloclasticus sp.]